MTPDVNILVAAARAGHTHTRAATRWLAQALDGATRGEPLILLPMVVAGYLRVVRIASITPTPISASGALTFVERILSLPNVALAPIGAEWPTFADFYRTRAPTGNDVTDAWIAAAVLHLDEHLVTFDRDFHDLLPPDQLTVLDPNAS